MSLRWGLLSTAKINDQILAGAAETDAAEIVAVGSRDGERAAAYAAEKGIPRAHGSYAELFADPEVDAVYVSLPNGMHHTWTLAALAAGKHVLCEKPYTRFPADVEEGWDAADAAGLVLMEAFMWRHHPQTLKAAELVAGGAIGELRGVNSTFTFPLTDLTNVRAQADLEGGALMDVGCYCVSASRLFAGEPLAVQGEQVIGTTGIDMGFHGTMRHAGDVVAQFEASFRAPTRQRLELVGADGVLTVAAPFRADWGGEVTLARGGVIDEIEVDQANAYRLELEDMARAVETGTAGRIGREDARGQARAIEALYRAAAERRVVEL